MGGLEKQKTMKTGVCLSIQGKNKKTGKQPLATTMRACLSSQHLGGEQEL